MSVRMFCNVVYAWLMARTGGDPESREKVDAALYAPLEGAAAMQERFWANLAALAGGDG